MKSKRMFVEVLNGCSLGLEAFVRHAHWHGEDGQQPLLQVAAEFNFLAGNFALHER